MITTGITGPRGAWGAAPTRFVVMFIALVLAYAGGQITLLWLPSRAVAPILPWL